MKQQTIVSGDTPQSQQDVIRVLCVDDSRDLTEALTMLLSCEHDMLCVGCLASADAVVEEVRRLKADVVIMDATMRGKNPFDAICELLAAVPQTRAIVFSAWEEAALLNKAVTAGASGLVCKTSDPETIVVAVREVAAGRKFFPI